MKMNKKIIVSTLALAMGAALAGSVSGTVAWFQYSTRAQAAFIGASAHCSEALEIQATAKDGTPDAAKWTTELTSAQVATATGITAGTAVEPITYGAALAATDALTTSNFKKNPIYQHFEYDEWVDATSANYYQFDLHFRVKDIDGEETVGLLAKKLYLTNLSIVSLDSSNALDSSNDLAKAVRVHLSCGSNNLLFANSGSGATVETVLGANLDLNNDGEFDKTPGYEWDTTSDVKAYGDSSLSQVANNVAGYTFADDSNPASITGSELGTTVDSGTMLKVTVTMWIEGWQGLSDQAPVASGVTDNAHDAQVWNPAKYVGEHFGVGFRFACESHVAH